MNRIARRFATVAVPAVALVSVVAFGTPAEAAATATVTWYGGPDYATVQLNDEAVDSAVNYGAGLGWGIDDLCSQVSGVINSKRQARGYTTGIEPSDCVSMVRDCVDGRQSNRVQVSIYADLTYGCGYY